MYLYDAETNAPLANVWVGVAENTGEIDYESRTNKKGKFILKRKWDYNTPCDRLPYFRPILFFRNADYKKESSDNKIAWNTSFPLRDSGKLKGDTIFLNFKS